ncbi:MAG TPA: hypothetical protein VJ894_06640, partial [Cryomorphaceae bacterium]|nr:hypothetical protein [Cryomorphaceae bacterium]
MRGALLAIFLLVSFNSKAVADFESIDIGILDPINPSAVQVIPEVGAFAVIADGQNKATIRAGERVSFSLSNGHVKVIFPGKTLGLFKDVRLMSLSEE